MEYSDFEEIFFTKMKKEKSNLVKIIETNNKIVLEYLTNREDLTHVKAFVNRFNDTLLEVNKFKNIETALRLPLMNLVYEEFKQSDVLIRALREASNLKAIKWLLTMPIDLTVQNSEGITAFMYAASHYNTEFVVSHLLIKLGKEHRDVEDNNGNTALFYSVNHVPTFKKLVELGMDYNHINSDGDSLLMYACKRDRVQSIETLLTKQDINYKHRNHLGKDAAMILVERNRCGLLKNLMRVCPYPDVNYKNKFGETFVTLFIKSFNEEIEKKHTLAGHIYRHYNTFKNYGLMLRTLLELKCDFNVVIDGDGNTPIIYFLLIKDYVTCFYLLKMDPSIDLSHKNKYGVNASFLSMIIDGKDISKDLQKYCHVTTLKGLFIQNPTFDFSYIDSYGNSLLIHLIYKEDPFSVYSISKFPSDVVMICNQKQENAVIVATKLGRNFLLEQLLVYNRSHRATYINQQDYLGNTALHYAVLLKDDKAIESLIHYGADSHIENNDGKSPLTLADEMKDSYLVKMLLSTQPLIFDDDKKKAADQGESSVPTTTNPMEKVKKEAVDEQLDKYIKNYRVTQYEKEYEYLGKYEFISLYRPSPIRDLTQQWILDGYTDGDNNANLDLFFQVSFIGTFMLF